MLRKYYFTPLFICLLAIIGCDSNDDISLYEEGEELLAGEFTSTILGSNAFDQSLPFEEETEELLFFVGNSLFKQNWVTAPASTTARDGLGPIFNARSCSSCHNKDGRGSPLLPGDIGSAGFLMRISQSGQNEHGGPLGVDGYGDQIQESSILGVPHEATVSVTFEYIEGEYTDGTTYELRKPIYSIDDAQHGDLSQALTSPRVGQQVIGLGLIDAVDVQTIRAFVDELDIDNDGISGKANEVWDVENQTTSLGKFGWKANQPTLRQQVAGALLGDMGLTSPIFPNENCESIQMDCQQATNGGEPEVTESAFENFMIYSTGLNVPIRRNYEDSDVLEGKFLFRELSCNGCHIEKMTTGSNYPFNPLIENLTIRPFSDFLLHDMGEMLADNRPDFFATGREWRTQPLWGIGLIEEVNSHTFLLHDGRARNIEEAILWHGGEAEQSKNDFVNLPTEDRDALIAFINSL